jgi:predicted O-methyltransferase YrrM
MAKRYEQILKLIETVKPELIVEVGVHRGMRAMLMCERALQFRSDVRYTGFDVFETMDEAFQAEALNGKGIAQRAIAEARLQSVKERWGSFDWKLIEGDTRVTLHSSSLKADLAFIDGDHRVEVIRGDAQALNCPVMVFDDYYLPGPDGRLPDLDRYGANRVVDEYTKAGANVVVLPALDKCDHGAMAALAVVRV